VTERKGKRGAGGGRRREGKRKDKETMVKVKDCDSY